jgi:hypothetical protein
MVLKSIFFGPSLRRGSYRRRTEGEKPPGSQLEAYTSSLIYAGILDEVAATGRGRLYTVGVATYIGSL